MKIFLIGFMGSGKTHWGKIWADGLQYHFYDLDEVIEKKESRSVADIFSESGEDYFRDKETEALQTLTHPDNYVIACGGGTPCFNDNLQWMNANGTTIYLQSSAEELTQRLLKEKATRPLIKHIDDNDLFLFVEKKLHERETFYLQAQYVVPTIKADPTTLKQLFILHS